MISWSAGFGARSWVSGVGDSSAGPHVEQDDGNGRRGSDGRPSDRLLEIAVDRSVDRAEGGEDHEDGDGNVQQEHMATPAMMPACQRLPLQGCKHDRNSDPRQWCPLEDLATQPSPNQPELPRGVLTMGVQVGWEVTHMP